MSHHRTAPSWLERAAYHIITGEASPEIAPAQALRPRRAEGEAPVPESMPSRQLESAIVHLIFFARIFIM
jgi:hypothetical protein